MARWLPVCLMLATICALGVAGMAAAFSAPHVSLTNAKAKSSEPTVQFATTAGKRTNHTCQATRTGNQTVKRGKFVPIACEQPPRVDLQTGSALAKAAAFAALG